MDLQCRNIHVSLEQKKILTDINLEIKSGQLISLLGPSGCGKSTLLKTIAGLLTPDEGEILIDGKLINQLPAHKRGTVIVFQDLRLFPNMNVEENIAFPLKMRGVSKVRSLKKAAELLSMVQLEGLGQRQITQMSGGQLQRVALARALATSPQILLLDEPFSSLDENLRQDMRSLLLALHKKLGITTLMVTHDPKEALMISDKIAIMLNGRIVQYDDSRSLYNCPANQAVADYFGPANYIEGEVRSGVFQSNAVCFQTTKKDGKYKAMFRPTAVKLSTGSGNYQIVRIDYMGEHSNITLQGNGLQILLTVISDDELKIGDKAAVEFDTTKAILLEAINTNNLVT